MSHTTRAVILVAAGFQDEEFVYPYYRMLEEGWSVDVAAAGAEEVRGKYGVPARQNKTINALFASDYDLVFIPGGFECPDRLRMIPDVQRFVQDMNTLGKIIASICHGPWVLISSDIVKYRKLTGYYSIKVDLRNAGATVSDDPVVRDGNLITADHYGNNGPFMRKVIEAVNGTITRSESPHAI